MAVRAFINFGEMLAFFEMANETRTFCDCDVFTLDDLGVTAGALELLSSSEIGKVDFVIENNLFKFDLSFQKPFIMTTFLEAALVFNLCPGLGFHIEFCPVAADHN